MDCRTLTDDLLLDYSERKLHRDPRKQVEKHLDGCTPCRDRFEEVKSIARVMTRTLAPNPPAELMAQLDGSVLRTAARKPRSIHPAIWAAAGVAAAAALIIGLVAWANRHEASDPRDIVGRPQDVVTPPVEPAKPAPPKPAPRRPDPEPELPKPEPPRPEPPAPEPVPPVNKFPRPEPPMPEPEPEPPKPEPPKPEPVPVPVLARLGDLNGDGKIDIADRMILTAYLNDEGEVDAKIADLNDDGRIDVADAQILSEMIAESR
jgi:hypothetical protein